MNDGKRGKGEGNDGKRKIEINNIRMEGKWKKEEEEIGKKGAGGKEGEEGK